MTGLGPVDLVVYVTPGEETNVYQVFGRLINATAETLLGLTIAVGFGIGDAFVRGRGGEGLLVSPDVRGTPTSAAGSQYPFGLFGDAATKPNFTISGVFDAVQRAGLEIGYSAQQLISGDFFGSRQDLFGGWLSQDQVPEAAAWEFDADVEALVMAWLTPDGVWELRRDVDPGTEERTIDTSISLTGDDVRTFDTLADLRSHLGLGEAVMLERLEDRAHLNINVAIQIGSNVEVTQVSLRTTVMPSPLPAGAPLLIGGVGRRWPSCGGAARRPPEATDTDLRGRPDRGLRRSFAPCMSEPWRASSIIPPSGRSLPASPRRSRSRRGSSSTPTPSPCWWPWRCRRRRPMWG